MCLENSYAPSDNGNPEKVILGIKFTVFTKVSEYVYQIKFLWIVQTFWLTTGKSIANKQLKKLRVKGR